MRRSGMAQRMARSLLIQLAMELGHRKLRFHSKAAVLAATLCCILLTIGCADVAIIGRPAVTPSTALEDEQVAGSVVSVDPKEKILYLRSSDGKEEVVRYGKHTTVIRQGREYLVESLRPGERITVRTGEGKTYTDLIIVERLN